MPDKTDKSETEPYIPARVLAQSVLLERLGKASKQAFEDFLEMASRTELEELAEAGWRAQVDGHLGQFVSDLGQELTIPERRRD